MRMGFNEEKREENVGSENYGAKRKIQVVTPIFVNNLRCRYRNFCVSAALRFRLTVASTTRSVTMLSETIVLADSRE